MPDVYSVILCTVLHCVQCYTVYSVTLCTVLHCVQCYTVYSVTLCRVCCLLLLLCSFIFVLF
jgi:hypothetical protein